MSLAGDPPVRTVRVHGHDRAFLDVGDGPAILLLHGIGSDRRTWDSVVPRLAAAGFRVVAPDFLGHGASGKPRADYSLGGFANGMRDLLTILGIDSATVVGHSFGGGVAMQFAYQYPERTERVVLVGAGGLGRDVHLVLRALTLPGAGPVLALATAPVPRAVARKALVALHRTGVRGAVDFAEMSTVYDGLAEGKARSAFLHVLRAAVDWRGQVVTMLDRSYLAAGVPVCVVWGERDSVIPADHARVAERALPHARLEIFERSGHFPHRADPVRFVDVVTSFIRETEGSRHDGVDWRALMVQGSA